jgi:tetratricopeptide (TPR) repeat protein
MYTFLQPRYLLTLLLAVLFVTHVGAQDIKTWTARAETGEGDVVLQEVTQYLASHADDYAAIFLQARLQAKQGDTAAAMKTYQQLIKLQPAMPEAYNNLATLYAQQGDYEQAQKLLEQAMHTHPSYATLYENLGHIYVERARDSYGKALQLDAGKQKLTLQELATVNPITVPASSHQASETVAVAVSKPVESKPAESKPVELAKPSVDQEAIITTLQGWAAAWSEQAPDVYLIFYADEYQPDGMSRKAWEQQRRERLKSPEWIQIGLSNFKVEKLGNDEARVEMIQEYRASNYQDKTRKLMRMRQTADGWRIIDEQSIAAVK